MQDSHAREARLRDEAHGSGRASASKTVDRDLNSLDVEIEDVQGQITRLQTLLQALKKEREEKLRQIRNEQSTFKGHETAGDIDYNISDFEWSGALQAKLMSVFGFESFRLCQEGYVHLYAWHKHIGNPALHKHLQCKHGSPGYRCYYATGE